MDPEMDRRKAAGAYRALFILVIIMMLAMMGFALYLPTALNTNSGPAISINNPAGVPSLGPLPSFQPRHIVTLPPPPPPAPPQFRQPAPNPNPVTSTDHSGGGQ